MPEVLDLVQSGRLHPELLTTRVATWEEAPEAMADPSAKVVITREGTYATSDSQELRSSEE